MTPFSVANRKPGGPKTIPVPCGKCPNCVARRVSQWSFRLMQEEKRSSTAYFVTLTYDTDHVPFTRNGFMELRKRDLQLFFKRLRKEHEKIPTIGTLQRSIKYYAVGEYGGIKRRPHYHIILFNADVKCIESAWKLGSVHYGFVSGASVGYTLKYISKPWKPLHRNDDRSTVFALMSKGIGDNYLTDEMVKWHNASLTDRMYCAIPGDKKIAMPRYYKERIYTETERNIAGHHARLKMAKELQKEMDEKGDMYYRDLSETDIAAFRRMEFKQDLGQKL